ncbi:MAG: hypothetical protein A2511_09425 [Deltaproteobacteria bacterium RIFOXYD12_FULL_50_9]|nr:MAG: hypothetical protein A2511_09425 [Deltaproteobacteria bacterium RIFOXYD12_FULL_50_9]
MFGIGLPELILIMAIALIVIGPDKLPDLAKTVAKQLLELKKAAGTLKDTLQDEMNKENAGGESGQGLVQKVEQPEPDSDILDIQAGQGPDSGVNPTAHQDDKVKEPLPPGSGQAG